MAYLFLYTRLLLAFSIAFLGVPFPILEPKEADAAQIKRIQSTTTTFAPADTTKQTILTNAVDLNQAFLATSIQSDDLHDSSVQASVRRDGGEGMGLFLVGLESSNTVNVSRVRDSDSGAFNAKVQVDAVEFNDGFRITKGTSNFDSATYQKDITIPTLQANSYFPLLSVNSTEWFVDENEGYAFKATFPNDSTLRIRREHLTAGKQNTGAAPVTMNWQVIELLTDATVQKGEVTMAATATSVPVTLGTAIANLNKAFLVFNYSGGAASTTLTINGVDAQMMVRGAITNATTLTFNRGLAGTAGEDDVYIAWYVVELKDDSAFVQGGSTSFLATEVLKTATLTAIEPTRTLPFVSVAGGTGVEAVNLHNYMVRASLTNGTTLSLERTDDTTLGAGVTEIAVTADWYVVEFAPLTVKSPNGGELWKVGEAKNVMWKHAAQLEAGGTCGGVGPGHKLKIEVCKDGATCASPLLVTGDVCANLDTYVWTIPETISATSLISATSRIRITDLDLSTRNYDLSNANFEVKGTLNLTAPDGGELWFVGDTTRNITWGYTGALGTVTLKYDTASGTGGYTGSIATGVSVGTSGLGSYAWNPIPDLPYNTMRVKIVADTDAAVSDTSAANFTIRPKITISAPNLGTEIWLAQQTQAITWTQAGTVPQVNISYSTNTGVDWTAITTSYAGGSPYNWLVPVAAIGTQTKVKVEKTGDSAVADTGPDGGTAVFEIKPSLKVTSPNDGTELWRVGESRNITWQMNGSIATVDLQYSTTGGSPYTNIVTGITGGSLSYTWTIPDAVTDQGKVKIKHPTDANIFDESDNNFKIRGRLTVTAPNGGEVWTVDSSRIITWTRDGTWTPNTNVDILYSTNGTSYPNTLATNVIGLSWTWNPIPDVIGNTVRVRVRANAATYSADTYDDSDANFSIKASLTLTAPNGGENWGAGLPQLITWNKTGTMTSVKLEYSTTGGPSYPNVIIASTAADTDPPTGVNNGQYSWTIPSIAGTQYRVQVTNVDDTTVLDTSNANFNVKGSLTVLAPNGGETWIVGDSRNITWDEIGGIANVKLEYSKNAFADELQTYTIAASLTAAAEAYAWTIPDAIGSNVKVRVTDTGDASVTDVSNAPFTIKGSVALTAPNGGETWIVGITQNITWSMTGSLGNVKLEYSTNGFSDELQTTVIAALTTADTAPTGDGVGSYAWLIPDAIGANVKVRVSQVSDSTVVDTSNLVFTIKGSLTITAPDGAEEWGIATSQSITWNKTGTLTGSLKLEYSTDSGITYPVGQLISNTVLASATSYAWTVPDAPTVQAKVKITYLNDTTVNDQSNANFKIKGSLTVNAPNGGETWLVGESRNITWTRGGSIANVKLDLSKDGGVTYPVAIVASTPAANQSYAWIVPDEIDNDLRVRVMDLADASVLDASNANFTIKPTATVTYPNGGETLIVGQGITITWNKTGTIANVKLEYSRNAFADELQTVTMTASTAAETDPPLGVGNGQFAWTVPDAIGTSLKIRITDLGAVPAAPDVSDAAFTIKGSLTLSSPNGAETWIVGESRNVVWTMTGSIANVKLEYSKNGFADETQTSTIVASTTAETDPPTGTGSGQYAWTVADAIGASLKVRVSNVADATVNDVSNAVFTIKGKLTLTSPNGSEVWAVGSSQNILWTRNGSIALVELRYSTDGGSTFPTVIVASTDADPLPADNAGSYAWTIPDAISTTVKVRVTNTADTTVFDDSDANFKIRGSLTVTAPNGGQNWTVGSSQNITWTKVGTIATVKLEYSKNAFADELQTSIIATAVNATTGTPYAWTIPDAVSTTVKVRVSNEADATVVDVSDANFTVLAGFAVTAPNGSEVWTVGSGQSITWTTNGTATSVELRYSTDGGLNYLNVITASTSNTGSYSWTVPDAITTAARIKVTHTANANAFDTSNGNFKIRGALTLTAPNGGELWGIATVELVKWDVTGSIANVKLEYSTNAFTNELQTTVITASTAANTDPPTGANNGQYSWTIPNTPSATAKIRISDAADSTVLDLSNGNFSIRGSVTLTAPNGTEVWVVGATQNITWNVYGAIANVKLQYSTDGGVTWPVGNVMTSSTPASTDPPVGADNGQYSWTVPDAIGTQLRVRVSDAADASVFDDSNANFTVKGSVTLTAPDGGQVWIVGASQNITWTRTGSFANVKLEYSKNGFADELQTVLISSSAPASPLSFAWTIPDAIGTALKVRVSDAADATVVDTSNANFEIKGSLTLTAPNGTEIWKVGESRNITWTKTGTIATAKLEYSTNSGITYPNVMIASTDATTGTYAWTVPDAIGTGLRVKITSTADATVNDTSNANFEIKGSVTLTAPNGTEVWTVGSSQNITWTRTGSFSFVKLEYSTNAFVDELQTTVINASTDADPLPTDNAGTYAWTIPDAISSTVRVRITNTIDAAVTDTSNANFKIIGSLTLTAPNGDPDGAGPLTEERWTVGQGYNVTWTKVGSIANVKIEYSTNSGTSYPNIIVVSAPAGTGAYTWTIPDSIGTTRRVKVSDAADSTVFDTSNGDFTVLGGFTISVPNGGEVWTVGSAQTVTWTTAGSVANVKLEYSTNGGGTYPNVMTASAINTGSYAWAVPDSISTLVKVRVSDVNNANALDVSNGNFKIRGALVLNAPNGGEAWAINTSQTVQWTRTGSIANVKLEYSTNGFSDELQTSVITASTPADPAPADNIGTYSWTIPDAPSTTVKVRVSDATDSTVLDLSNANFSVKGSVTLTAPNGSEAWVVGGTQNIAWTKFGNIANVKLQYSADGGTTWPVGNLIISSTPADPAPADNAGSYSWTIPDAIGTQLRVRVSDAADASVFDDSNANFMIKGSVTLTSPNGSEIWIVGATQNITWNKTGSYANVKLEYSKNGFADELQTFLITGSAPSGTPASSGSYAWTIPDAIGSTVKVRVSDAADATVVDTSNANFEIKGSLTLTAPNGSEIWKVSESRNITWTKTGSIANVKLEYSVNGGTSYPNVITASTDATTGTYAWTMPDAIGTQVRVRVTNTADAAVNDASNANFEIKGSVTLTAPNGSEVWRVGESRNITWTRTGSFSFVKLEYSKNGFVDELQTFVINASTDADPLPTDNAGIYAWTIPDAISNNVRVRITNTTDAAVLDMSDANFAIKGLITLTSPNGGELWIVSAAKTVTWTSQGTFANVKLEYSTNGFADELQTTIITSSTPNNGSYAWTVPDAIGANLKVRASDVGDASVNDVSNTAFEIKGSLTLTSPNGAETLVVGNVHTITWTKVGTIANVELRYSTDGGTTYPNVIVSTTPGGSLSYAWTVPDALSTTARVKVTNLADSSVNDTSDANFAIKGSLTLVSPNGTELWLVGESRNITWTKTGTMATVKLEYSANGGTTYPSVIIASTNADPLPTDNAGIYAWTIPDAIGTTVRVRVTDTADASVFDTSNGNFEIAGAITVTAPNGGEIWVVNESRNITWTKQGTLTTVKLEYSRNAFADELQTTVIIASVDATTGTPYAWTVPDAISSTVRVRVTSNQYATVKDVSDANFKIRGAFTLTAPNGDPDGAGPLNEERWTVGTSQNVTWTKIGSIANAKLEYSTDGGATYTNVIIASTAAGTGAYAWTIPDAIGTNRRVRIADASDATVLDTSDGNFAVLAGFTLSAPNGGEVWTVNSAQTLSWTTAGTVVNVKLEYSTNGGLNYPNVITASTPNTGSYAWTVPDAITTGARVRISDVANANALDVSNANFKIRGSLTLSAPNGGELWQISSSQTLSWTRVGSLANVKLEYSTNGFSDELQTYVITTSTPADPLPADNAGTYAWTMPDTPTITAKVRVSDATDATVNDLSNANFSIRGSVTLNTPNGSEAWVVSTTQNITWTKAGSIANVALRYSTDGGLTWPVGNIITSATPADPLPTDNNGSYSWTIPDAIGTQLRVRVNDAADASVSDDSNGNFTIKGSITVTAPNGSEVWIVGATQNITWNKAGSFTNVKLEYSKNGFADELQTVPITASTPNTGTFAWTVADAIGTAVKVRAIDAADSTVVDTSNTNFEIKGSLALTAPNGGEIWRVGESRNVTWTKTGSIANVKLDYSTNGGTSYPNVITASTSAATGTYAWTIPDAIGTQLQVKVTDATDATVTDASNANFEIKGSITVTAPNGGEVWVVNSTQNITWTRTGTFANVKLEYSKNAFADELQTTVILAATAADPLPTDNAGSYAWTVPDAIGSSVRVRITHTGDAAVVDTSDANFKIVGSFTLTAPNGDPDGAGPLTEERWTVGASQNITWTKVGSIANAKLEYSSDGGSTYTNVIIASTGAAAGAYAWTIPDSIGTNRRVRIADASDATVLDTSNGNFTVMAGFTLSAPNGGEVWTVGSAQTVSWTSAGTAANVKLEYSTDGGSSYPNVIIASTLNTGTYGWTVPDAITTLAKVRVSDAVNANALDVSNGNFKIRGALLLTAPNGGERWEIGTSQNIAWTRTGSIANVKLEYSTNGFTDELQTVVLTSSTPADPLPADNAGTYAWTIPNVPSTTLKIRLSDSTDSTVLDTSNANFSIVGRLVLNVPNGSEVWAVGTTQNITWTRFGSIANVKLEYSTDGGVTWPVGNLMTSSAPADPLPADDQGIYSWTIPDAISTTVRVRVLDASDTSVSDTSDANFKIKGQITVTSPNGNEVWVVGESRNITWTKQGTFANAKLEYSKNGFVDETQTFLITSATPAVNLSFSWTVADALGTLTKVRASDAADATVADASNANFTIKGGLVLGVPNGGEVWRVGETRNITWTRTGSIANVKLDYSTDGGFNYSNAITASTPAASGSYTWTIPDAIGAALRVKVTDLSDASVFDASDGNFTVKALLTLTQPNGGEVLTVGTTQNVIWTKSGTVATVKLEFSSNGFADELQTSLITASVDATMGTPYAVTIPDAIGTMNRIRVTNNSDTTVVDISDGFFKIIGAFTLTAPNGGEIWTVGTSQNITWTKVGSIANAKLAYSTDGGSTWPLIVASTSAGALAYLWTIPDAVSATVRVRISDSSDATVYDDSNADFRIRSAYTVTAPNGGEQWLVGNVYNITWTQTGTTTTVKLEYSRDNFASDVQLIAGAAPSGSGGGSYAWTIPDSVSATVKVRVSNPADAAANDVSNANFKISPRLTLVAPNGGEQWMVGSNYGIAWNFAGTMANVKLEYSKNGFADETQTSTIVASTPSDPLPTDNAGSYNWIIPDAISAMVKVRVSDSTDATANDISNANFKIKTYLELTAPDGAEVWTVGTSQYVTWTFTGTVANVKLEYSTDGGATYPLLIIASTPADTNPPSAAKDGRYAWTIPDAIGTTLRVKVTDASDADASSASNANFKVQGALTLTAPNGGERWGVNTTQNITWTRTGSIANVKLEYSTDGGFTYPTIIIGSTPADPAPADNAGSYAWLVPDTKTPTAKVRVSDVTDFTVLDVSNANFSIEVNFTLTAPNGGEVWTVGESRNIAWNWGGTITAVKLEYSKNAFADETQTTLITSAAPNPNLSSGSTTYAWTIPNAISTALRVRISDPGNANVFDISNANFKIKGKLDVTSPNTNVRWITNETQTISWTTTGTIANVKLEYSTDGGTTYPYVIAASLPNTTGTYAWLVPDTQSTTAKVRVLDASDLTVFDESDVTFRIDLYQITFEVRDLLSNAHLNTISVASTSSPSPYTWSASGLNSPFVKGLQAGSWTLTFSQSAYGDQSVTVSATADQVKTVFLETKVVHIYEAIADLAYNPDLNKLSIGVTLRRDGIALSGADWAELKIIDPATPGSPVYTKTWNSGPDINGFYNDTWTATTLSGDIVYNVTTKVRLASTQAIFTTPSTLTVQLPKFIKQQLDAPLSSIRDNVNQSLGFTTADLAAGKSMKSELAAQTTTLKNSLGFTDADLAAGKSMKGELATQTSTINTAINDFTNQVSSSLVSLDAAASRSDLSTKKLEEVALTQSGRLLTPPEATTGLPLSIKWRGPSDTTIFTPTIKIENALGIVVVKDVSMQGPLSGTTNLYEYVIDPVKATDYTPGRNVVVTVTAELQRVGSSEKVKSVATAPIFIKRPEGRLIMRQDVKAGEKVSIKLIGAENWTPHIQLNSQGVTLTANTAMRQVSTEGKVTTFEYEVPANISTLVPVGAPVTAIVSEPLTGFFDQGTFSLTRMSLDDLAGQIAAQSGGVQASKEALRAINDVRGSLATGGNVTQALDFLKRKVVDIPRSVAQESGSVQMRRDMNEVAQKMKELAGDQGFDFSQLIKMGVQTGLEQAPSVKEIRKKTDKIQGVTEVMQILMERKLGGMDAPIIHAIYE